MQMLPWKKPLARKVTNRHLYFDYWEIAKKRRLSAQTIKHWMKNVVFMTIPFKYRELSCTKKVCMAINLLGIYIQIFSINKG
eukprot:c24014_g1_i1 orf=3-245(-)